LYKATDKKLADAEQITDGFGTPFLKKPIFQCDLIDEIQGFAAFAPINGALFNLGYDSGLKHHFVDNTVENGRTYYYVLVAYDYGVDSSSIKIPPSENTFILELDEYENIRKISQNVAVVKPHQFAAGYQEAKIEDDVGSETLGTGWARPEILLPAKAKEGHEYKIKFGVEMLIHDWRAPISMLHRNDAIRVYDVTENNRLVYEETKANYSGDNFKRIKKDIFNVGRSNLIMNYGRELTTAEFDGLIVRFFTPHETAQFNPAKSGWITGSAPISIEIATRLEAGGEQKDIRYLPLPYEYDIVFTNNDSAYVTTYAWPRIWRERESDAVQYNRDEIFYNQNFNFYVVNRSIQDESGSDLIMDMVAVDINENGSFDILEDDIFVGTTYTYGGFLVDKWAGTAFTLHFKQIASESGLPQAGDVYHVSFESPFMESDSIIFTVSGEQIIATNRKNDRIAFHARPNWIKIWKISELFPILMLRPIRLKPMLLITS